MGKGIFFSFISTPNSKQSVEDGPAQPAEAPQEVGEKSLLVPPSENPEAGEEPPPSGQVFASAHFDYNEPEEKEGEEDNTGFGKEEEDLV